MVSCVRRCCEVLHLQLGTSKPQAEGYWAGRLHRMLTRSLPPVLSAAPPSLVIPWLEFYAKNGLVDHDHLRVWETAGESVQDALLSYSDEDRILKLQKQVPLWIAECLPQVAPRSDALVHSEQVSQIDMEEDAFKEVAQVTLGNDQLQLQELTKISPGLSPPMYQKSPPVPVLWHTSPENYQRGLSRLGARQLILALRYVAADGAGTLARGVTNDFSAQKAIAEAAGNWPRRHRSRTRAQAFVATLLSQLMSRIGGSAVKSSDACSAVKSLASLRRIGLANSPEAGEALQALFSGPLAGWKVVTSLTPSDVSLLLEGVASLVAGGKGSPVDDQPVLAPVQVVARGAMEGSTAQLLELASCALQEAGAPPTKLRAMCGAAAVLFTWHQRAHRANLVQARHSQRAMQRFLRAAAVAARDGPHTKEPQLVQPLAVLRAAGDAKAWSSDVFASLAPMVTELIFGRPVPKLPGFAHDWRPLLPRVGYTRRAWQIEELAEIAWLYAQSSSRRPLEGQTAVALSLTLLVHLPVLEADLRTKDAVWMARWKGLCNPQASTRPDIKSVALEPDVGSVQFVDSVDGRLLMFACDAARILRNSAEVIHFQPWGNPKFYPRKRHESKQHQLTSIEHFDPQLARDGALATLVMGKWKGLVKLLDVSGASLGARRRVRALIERKETEWLGSNVMAALAALDIFGCCSNSGDVLPLTGPAKSCLLKAYSQQSLAMNAESNFQARSQLRACLRQLRLLKRKQLQKEGKVTHRICRSLAMSGLLSLGRWSHSQLQTNYCIHCIYMYI